VHGFRKFKYILTHTRVYQLTVLTRVVWTTTRPVYTHSYTRIRINDTALISSSPLYARRTHNNIFQLKFPSHAPKVISQTKTRTTTYTSRRPSVPGKWSRGASADVFGRTRSNGTLIPVFALNGVNPFGGCCGAPPPAPPPPPHRSHDAASDKNFGRRHNNRTITSSSTYIYIYIYSTHIYNDNIVYYT